MANDFSKLGFKMGLRAKQVVRNSQKLVQRAAVAADSWVVLATPVDTGRARANWITNVGSPSSEITEDTDESGANAISQGQSTIGNWRLGDGTIFITNSLPYIIPLDEGSSEQRREGMTVGAIQAAQDQLDGAKLLK